MSVAREAEDGTAFGRWSLLQTSALHVSSCLRAILLSSNTSQTVTIPASTWYDSSFVPDIRSYLVFAQNKKTRSLLSSSRQKRKQIWFREICCGCSSHETSIDQCTDCARRLLRKTKIHCSIISAGLRHSESSFSCTFHYDALLPLDIHLQLKIYSQLLIWPSACLSKDSIWNMSENGQHSTWPSNQKRSLVLTKLALNWLQTVVISHSLLHNSQKTNWKYVEDF